MKDPVKLQAKLANILRGNHHLRVSMKNDLSELEFDQIAWVVQDFVDHSGEVTNDDPLHEWVEEYRFYSNQRHRG